MMEKDKASGGVEEAADLGIPRRKGQCGGREELERMLAKMKKLGNKNVKLTVYPEATHNSWAQTYDNPKLYEWFLQYQK